MIIVIAGLIIIPEMNPAILNNIGIVQLILYS